MVSTMIWTIFPKNVMEDFEGQSIKITRLNQGLHQIENTVETCQKHASFNYLVLFWRNAPSNVDVSRSLLVGKFQIKLSKPRFQKQQILVKNNTLTNYWRNFIQFKRYLRIIHLVIPNPHLVKRSSLTIMAKSLWLYHNLKIAATNVSSRLFQTILLTVRYPTRESSR